MVDEFKLFKEEFKKWQDKFGLKGWAIYFEHTEIEEHRFAEIYNDIEDMAATVRLNNKLCKENEKFKDVEKSAKHEAIHLLLARLEACARYRYVNEDEITEACEELVHKLEELI